MNCILCNKEYNTENILYCPECEQKIIEECGIQDNITEEDFIEEFYKPNPKSNHYPEPNEFYTCNCRGAGCIQCQPNKYL